MNDTSASSESQRDMPITVHALFWDLHGLLWTCMVSQRWREQQQDLHHKTEQASITTDFTLMKSDTALKGAAVERWFQNGFERHN